MTGLVKKESPDLFRYYLNGKEIATAERDSDGDWYLDVMKEDGTIHAGYIEESQIIKAICEEFPEWEKQYKEHYDEVQEDLK
jgi:hypothetical protein